MSKMAMLSVILFAIACGIGFSAGTPRMGFGAPPRGPGGLPGGWFPLDPNSPMAWDLGLFLAGQFGPGHVLVRVLRAKQQVVAGMNYYIVARINKINSQGLAYEFLQCIGRIYQDLMSIKHLTYSYCWQIAPFL